MKVILGIVLGLFSGILTYMAAAMLLVNGEPSGGFVAATLIGGWALSTWLMVRRSRTVSRVLSRGFLLGAAEWLAMIPIALVVVGKGFSDTMTGGPGTDAALAGASIGAGMAGFAGIALAVTMALLCLICYVVTRHLGHEMKAEV